MFVQMTGGEGPLSASADESVVQPDNTHTGLRIPPVFPTPLRQRLAFHLALRLNRSRAVEECNHEPA